MVDKFLSPCTVHIIDSNIIRARMNVYETQIRKYGGQFLRKVTSDDRITHLLVDDDLPEEKVAKIIATRFPKLLEDGEGETKLLRTKWLSACLKHKKLVDPAPYVVHLPKPEEKTEVDQAKGKPRYSTVVFRSCLRHFCSFNEPRKQVKKTPFVGAIE